MQKKNIRDQFLSTLSLVCRIPIPFSFAFNVKRLDLWLPLTALFQSLLFGLSLSLCFLLLRSLELSVLSALAVYYGVFNLFHFDGLLDTADAFLGAFEREKRQEILKDPRLGVYAVFTGIIYIAAKILVLLSLLNFLKLYNSYSQISSYTPLAALPLQSLKALSYRNVMGLYMLFLFPLAGKTGAALIPGIFLPARAEGLGALAKGSKAGFSLLGSGLSFLLYSLVCLGTFLGLPFGLPMSWDMLRPISLDILLALAIMVCSAVIVGLYIGRLYQKGLGGYTGDSLGAAIELGELLYLLILYVLMQRGMLF